MSETLYVKCPHCEGRGPFLAFVHRNDGSCTQEMLPCSFCKGCGDVSEHAAHAFHKGRELMKLRQSCDRSVMEVAKLLGISSAAYSGIEHGRNHGNYEQIAARIKDWL